MRRAYNDYGFVEENGQVMGFCLGYDFCAEHEFGSDRIKDMLNIPINKKPVGLEERKSVSPVTGVVFEKYNDIQKVVGKSVVTDKEKAAFLICAGRWELERMQFSDMKSKRDVINNYASFNHTVSKSHKRFDPAKDNIVVSWSGNDGFAINVRGEENVKKLEEIHQAILAGDICMTDLTGTAFMRKSGALGIYSRIPQEIKDSVKVADLERDRILKKVADSGIEEKLKAAGKGWYALSPREMEDGSLEFFLNPTDQNKNKSGWFSIQDLEEWIQGKGPVATGKEAEKLMEEFGNSIDGLRYGISHKINEEGFKVGGFNEVMIDGVPHIRLKNSTHPELNGDVSLDRLKEIFEEKKKMKP